MLKNIESLWEAIAEAEKVLVLTGAGISTLSGIPDFRGSCGVYQKKWHGMARYVTVWHTFSVYSWFENQNRKGEGP